MQVGIKSWCLIFAISPLEERRKWKGERGGGGGAGGTGEAKFRLIHSEEASKLTSALYPKYVGVWNPNPNIPYCRQLKVLGLHKYLSWFEIGTGWRDFGTIFLIIDSLGTSIYLLHGILVTNTNITLMNGMVEYSEIRFAC